MPGTAGRTPKGKWCLIWMLRIRSTLSRVYRDREVCEVMKLVCTQDSVRAVHLQSTDHQSLEVTLCLWILWSTLPMSSRNLWLQLRLDEINGNFIVVQIEIQSWNWHQVKFDPDAITPCSAVLWAVLSSTSYVIFRGSSLLAGWIYMHNAGIYSEFRTFWGRFWNIHHWDASSSCLSPLFSLTTGARTSPSRTATRKSKWSVDCIFPHLSQSASLAQTSNI